MKKQLFNLAWSIVDQFENFGEALKHAWKVIKLKAKMMTSNVRFKYHKVNGDVRQAIGTLTRTYESKGTGRPVPADSILYFDTEANGFRSFKAVNLI